MAAGGGVALLEERTGERFEPIARARGRTASGLAERRAALAGIELDGCVVLMGSWGRGEVTSGSDDDYVVLMPGAEGERAAPGEEVRGALSAIGRRPGPEGVFGEVAWLDDLRGRIGLDADTNANLTRRMLFVLESVAVAGEDLHAQARRAILAGYLERHSKDYRPPRFFLNDLIRYWRTIAVDFEGKLRSRSGEGWGLRSAKLRLSRKALFAGGLLPALQCATQPAASMLDFLDGRLAEPPLDRIARAFVEHGALDAGVRTLHAYGEFLELIHDESTRSELAALGADESQGSALFQRVRELGVEFQDGLLALLYDDPQLGQAVREYLIF